MSISIGTWFELAGVTERGMNRGTNVVGAATGLKVATVGFRSAASFSQIYSSAAYVVRNRSTYCRKSVSGLFNNASIL